MNMLRRRQRRWLIPSLWVLCLAAVPLAARESGLLRDELERGVGFEQHVGGAVSSDLRLVDAKGDEIAIGSLTADGRPLILVLGYNRCRQLCDLVLNGLLHALREIKPTVGRDFDVAFVSIDPSETPAMAAQKRRVFAQRYGRDGSFDGWHFLTGNEDSIRQLAREVGFRYLKDPARDDFAHPGGMVLLAPDGTISSYFFGIEFRSRDLEQGLRAAGRGDTGTIAERLLLLCYHYDPLTGKYGLAINRLLRVSAALTVGALALFIVVARRREKRIRRREARAADE